MRLLIKLLLCLMAVASSQCLCAQEESAKNDSLTASRVTTRIFLDIGRTVAVSAFGDNYIASGYKLRSGLDLDFSIHYNKISTHAKIVLHKGDVIDRAIVGNLETSNFTRLSVGVEYVLDIGNRFFINPSLHYGYLKIGTDFPQSKDFLDDGHFIGLSIKANYEIWDWLGVYGSVTGHNDFLRIKTASRIQDKFNNTLSIYPAIGIRFILKSGKPQVPGTPGNGIFTRKDGLSSWGNGIFKRRDRN